MINYEMEKNEGDLNFKSKEQAILELIVVSNSVLKILDTDGVDDAELKEVYTRVLTPIDWQIIKDYHGMKEAQKRRLLKYMETLKQLEELEKLE